MRVLLVYCFVTWVLAILICLLYSLLGDKARSRGWEHWWYALSESLIFIALGPITAPWWFIELIRAQKFEIKISGVKPKSKKGGKHE